MAARSSLYCRPNFSCRARPPLSRTHSAPHAPPPSSALTAANTMIAIGLGLLALALSAPWWQQAPQQKNHAEANTNINTKVLPARVVLQTALLSPELSQRLQTLLKRTGIGIQRIPLLPQWLAEARPQLLRLHGEGHKWWLERRDEKGPIAVLGLGNDNAHPAFAKFSALPPELVVQAELPRCWWQNLLPALPAQQCTLWSQLQARLPEQANWRVFQSSQAGSELSWCLSWPQNPEDLAALKAVPLPAKWSSLRATPSDQVLLHYAPAANCGIDNIGVTGAPTLLRIWQDASGPHQALLSPLQIASDNELNPPLAAEPTGNLSSIKLHGKAAKTFLAHGTDASAARWLRAATGPELFQGQTQTDVELSSQKNWLYSYVRHDAVHEQNDAQESTETANKTDSPPATEIRAFSDQAGVHLCLSWPMFGAAQAKTPSTYSSTY